MRADESLSVHLLIVEHLISGAKISSLKVLLGGTMAQEKVIWHSILQIAFIKSYDRWILKR